jgi:hypothetical protein
MNQPGQIEIQIDKTKMRGLMFASYAFVLIGIIFLFISPLFFNLNLGMGILVCFGGILSIVFFGFAANTLSKKINDNSPGIIINDYGFIDNASGVSAGFVPWKDVIRIEERTVVSQTFIMIILRNPEEYISRQGNYWKQKTMRMNLRLYGSPVSISANALKIDYGELYRLFANQLENFLRSQNRV